MRFVLGVEYDGSRYCGWQRQKDKRSIQAMLEAALSSVAGRAVSVVCAGRTDAGVHARGQIVHFDVDVLRDARAWVLGSNSQLPNDIRVTGARQIKSDFHARYCANARYYRYVINNRTIRSALFPTQETWIYHPLDQNLMQQAARYLIGEHDFSSFRSSHCQSKSTNRWLYILDITRDADHVVLELVANAFLHHMVRNIAGVLIDIGLRKAPPVWIRDVLDARDRNAAGVTASAHGLYLTGVDYPDHFGLSSDPIFKRLPKDTKRYD